MAQYECKRNLIGLRGGGPPKRLKSSCSVVQFSADLVGKLVEWKAWKPSNPLTT